MPLHGGALGEHFRAIGFDLHSATTAVPTLASPELRRDLLDVERKAGRHPLQNDDKCLAVRFACSQKAQHAKDILDEVFATLWRPAPSRRGSFAGDVLAQRPRMIASSHTLIADRFLQMHDGRTLDLASGEHVALRLDNDHSMTDEWAERCAALYVRRHPQLVELVDYGGIGPTSRFEAFWTQGPIRPWRSGDGAAMRALRSAAAFLAAHELSPGSLDRSRVIDVNGQPRLLPDASTGFAATTKVRCRNAPQARSRAVVPTVWVNGIVIQARTAVDRVLDFLEEPWSRGARWLQLRGPSGAGVSTALRLLAREVRLRGFVPLSTSLIAGSGWLNRDRGLVNQLLDDCVGRHVVLLHDHDEFASTEERVAHVARCVLVLGAELARLRIAIVSVANEDCGSPSVAMEPLTLEQLLAIVSRGNGTTRQRAFLSRAARASRGWPGRFLRSLGMHGDPCLVTAFARERAPAFATPAGEPTAETGKTGGADLDGWKRLVEARGLLRRGRHAAAARTFREAVGMFERREDQLHAGTAWYELGELCLVRGGVDSAQHAFKHAGQCFRDAGATARAVMAAAGEGVATMETGHLNEAEMILRTSDLATAQSRISNEGLTVRTALIRCLHWQGRADDATTIIERESGPHADGQRSANRRESVSRISKAAEEPDHLIRLEPTHVVRWHAVAAEIAIERRALDEAALHVNAAVAASSDDQPLERCVAHTVAVSFHGRVGDAEAARLHAASALRAARAAHAPIEALRLRMTLSVALDQAGARSDAHTMAMRLLRVKQSKIPALLGCQLGLALARTLPDSAVARGRGEQAAAFAHAIGAAGLLSVMSTSQGLPKPLSDIIEVVRSTQDYEDDGALLERVAQLLRNRLGALSVAFTPAQDADTAVVSAGSGRGSGAPRAMNAGVLLGPLRTSAGIEIAAPIRCGGTTVGALGCRWSAAGPDNAEHARALIATTAIVSGPFFKALLDRRLAPPESQQCPELLGISAAMTELRRAIARAAAAPFPVLIVGESGVGKELVARAIHREGPRRLRNFAPLNCAALTEDLVEAELFGHARGAFTGAVAERRGIFEEADGGSVFLDEVSELSPRAQAKLLRVLQEGEVRRVGESFARHVDVRIVAATNRALDGETAPRQFRQDLRYRLDVIRLEVPPLRQRVEDIPVLATAFWARVAPLTGCRAILSSSAIATLARYDWPGNVRELQNVIAALVVAAPRHGTVTASALPSAIARSATLLRATSLDDARLAFERRFVAAALARAGGKSGRAAKELGMTRQGLAKLVKRLGIQGIPNTEYRIPKTKLETEGPV